MAIMKIRLNHEIQINNRKIWMHLPSGFEELTYFALLC